jgi:rhodanese-related sulfurtransferase
VGLDLQAGGALERTRQIRNVLCEALLVALAGVSLAFVANTLSSRGLKLNGDPFRFNRVPETPSQWVGGTNTNSPAEVLAARLKAHGLQLAESNLVTRLFRDTPLRDQQLIVFIDARDEDHYLKGHIPGAFEFDPYHQEKYLETVWPVCRGAQQIVVYCNGGDCYDSELAAGDLHDLPGAPKDGVFVYSGGITEWATNGLPIEAGERNSGQLLGTNK